MAEQETAYATIIISATHGKLGIVRNATIASNTINTIKIKFDFRTEDWSGLVKNAIFCNNLSDEEKVLMTLDSDDECFIPHEVTDGNKNSFFMGIYGTGNEKRIVSNYIKFNVINGSYAAGVTSKDPTPDVYEQMLEKFTYTAGDNIKIENNVISAIVDADLPVHTYDWLVDNYPDYCSKLIRNEYIYYTFWLSSLSDIPNGIYIEYTDYYPSYNSFAVDKISDTTESGYDKQWALYGFVNYFIYTHCDYTDSFSSNIDMAKSLIEASVNKTKKTATYSYLNKANSSNTLFKTNTTEYTPTEDYHPATKKYVDDVVNTKQDVPINDGAYGQIFSLNEELKPVWVDQKIIPSWVVSDTEPEDKSAMWIDTSDNDYDNVTDEIELEETINCGIVSPAGKDATTAYVNNDGSVYVL